MLHISFATYFKYSRGEESRLYWDIDSEDDHSSSCMKSFDDKMHSPKTKYVMTINTAKLSTVKSQHAMREKERNPFQRLNNGVPKFCVLIVRSSFSRDL